jgi:hypothetical protein
MSERNTSRKSNRPAPIIRNKEYYFNTLDLEHDLLVKATSIAERMMVAFMRENKVEVSVDVDDIADKIIAKLDKKLQSHTYSKSDLETIKTPGFNYDDGPVILKTEKVSVKGKVGSVTKSGDSISDSMNSLEDLNI